MSENPSAFPHPVPVGCWGDPSCGMTLRDWFATHAMAADLNAGLMSANNNTMQDYAEDAYRMADAMLAARNNDLNRQSKSTSVWEV